MAPDDNTETRYLGRQYTTVFSVATTLLEAVTIPVFFYMHTVLFKSATIVFKCLRSLAPSYLVNDCVLVSAAAACRSTTSAVS